MTSPDERPHGSEGDGFIWYESTPPASMAVLTVCLIVILALAVFGGVTLVRLALSWEFVE